MVLIGEGSKAAGDVLEEMNLRMTIKKPVICRNHQAVHQLLRHNEGTVARPLFTASAALTAVFLREGDVISLTARPVPASSIS